MFRVAEVITKIRTDILRSKLQSKKTTALFNDVKVSEKISSAGNNKEM